MTIETPPALPLMMLGDYVSGPDYPNMGTRVAKFRRIPRDQLTPEQKREYSDAIRDKILSLQNAWWRAKTVQDAPPRDIGAFIRGQQAAALARHPGQVRKARTPAKWQEMYEEAIKEKRKCQISQAKYARSERRAAFHSAVSPSSWASPR